MNEEAIKRYAAASRNLQLAVADLVEVDRLRRMQNKNLAFAVLDGNQIVHRDWCAAIKALVAASTEYDTAEDVVEAS